jgi:ligand-binding sensor domain-containing protein/signal transduction histidine kinase
MGWRAILILLSAFPSLLKSELLPIRTYTTADGLAADHVDCIVPDSRGFLWFCTPEGLSRFDGYHFVSYGVREGLAHRVVSTLVETRTGEYLVGTARGISRVVNPTGPPGQGARFATYAPEPPTPQSAAQNSVTALHESRSGKIWCATPRSLFEWNATSGFRRRELPLPPRVIIASIVEDPGGELWIGTTGGIYRLGESGVVQTFHVKEGLPGYWVEMLLMDSQGRLWAALRGGLALISRGATGSWGIEKIFTDKSGLVGWDVKALAEASDGTLWVGTTQGISRLRLGAGEPVVLQNLTRAQGLSDRQITALAEDQAGNIWAGTEGAGVMRIDRLGFTTYRELDGLETDRVFSAFEDQAGELLAVTSGAGDQRNRSLEIFDGVRFHGVTPRPYGDRAGWGWNQVLLQGGTGEWWAATKDGLCRYPAMKAAELGGRNPRICYSRDDEVFRVFEDSKGGIWASAQSSRGDELIRWDPRTDSVFRFPAPRTPGGAADDLVSAFAEDRQGNIWMGLNKGGLYRYDGHSFQHFQQRDGMPGGPVSALLAGEAGLWIGSDGGLGRVMNTADERLRIEIYDTARGMASDTVNCIVEDRQGRIYAGTTKGVDRLDPRTGYIRHFSSGLAHGECTAAVRDRSGSLWFATKQGLSRLIPRDDRPPVNPRVFITDLRIGGTPYATSTVGETRVSRLELNPSQNQLQVEFVGLDYEPGDVLRYSYRLEGADPDWSPPRSQLTVNYAALASGTYRFLVKAVTSEGVESSSPAGIDFTVLPPLWRRWWFESLAVALAAGLVFAAHRYRVTQMVNLERMRTAIATDLHDDIGSSLSHIAVLSEVARAGVGGENRRTQESLERVAVLARELVDSLSDIVWSIRAVPDGLDSLVSRMREFALDLLGGQRIDFELRAPPAGQSGQQLSLQARRHLFLMFKECIHNASRHSACTAVKAELKVVEREILLTVADNGRGVQLAEMSPGYRGGNGIPGMRRRAETLGGSIRIVSEPGKGCTVSMRLPLRRSLFAAYRT